MCGGATFACRRTAINSAVLATAISSGVIAPMSNPTGVYVLEQVLRNSFLSQCLENLDYLALRSIMPTSRRCLDRPAQDAHVITMPSRHDHNIRRLTRIERLHRFIEIQSGLAGGREAILRRIGSTVIRDNHVETCIGRGLT